MQWTDTRPSTEGRHRWREQEGARIHLVRIQVRKGQPMYHCNTMDLRKVLAGGQWCHDDAAAPHVDAALMQARNLASRRPWRQ